MHEAEVHYDANPHQGPRQPGNDIDVYLKPLVEELLVLWNKPGVRVWDEYKQEHFDLRQEDTPWLRQDHNQGSYVKKNSLLCPHDTTMHV